ncbi:efflux RND transporter periplasmic adaptor subunit [Geobacter sulfurreducens]|uniref:efflux RND transporter periplasmic adaptor subunit n=1 Tax=Geobacter sulfurreducens TaxID=35554 RepID=UPI0020B7E336|nr:efflux RND transporter periplasmic adaptor subunit [Geobacter sulfurreducens]UTG92103.1 efflux RND transporter periplasmic adaptor subunit [Geobacter sulfurreducens]
MKKRIILTIIGLVAVIAVLGGIKALQIGTMIDHGKKFVPPPETVSTAPVKAEAWETALTSVGTLTAVQGVTVAAELPGKVVQIAFEAGAPVARGALLLRQDTSNEEAQLPGALAEAKLARANLRRSDQLLAEGIIAQADHDSAVATANQAQAQVDNIRATIAKKSIRAPFSGRLGIRQVNLGQILREGDPIVTLQSMDPIFVDFTLPQQQLSQLRKGLAVRVTTDALPGETVEGRVTAINPEVDAESRNIKVQATVANRGEKLRPGMFVNVAVGLPVQEKVLAIPATAVLYAPYSDSVFVVEDDKDKKGKVLRQQFVRLGTKRGDFVAVTSGLKEGEQVVSTGVFKLRNGQAAVVDNKLAPPFQQAPNPENN